MPLKDSLMPTGQSLSEDEPLPEPEPEHATPKNSVTETTRETSVGKEDKQKQKKLRKGSSDSSVEVVQPKNVFDAKVEKGIDALHGGNCKLQIDDVSLHVRSPDMSKVIGTW
jgi:hypothetical protein